MTSLTIACAIIMLGFNLYFFLRFKEYWLNFLRFSYTSRNDFLWSVMMWSFVVSPILLIGELIIEGLK